MKIDEKVLLKSEFSTYWESFKKSRKCNTSKTQIFKEIEQIVCDFPQVLVGNQPFVWLYLAGE